MWKYLSKSTVASSRTGCVLANQLKFALAVLLLPGGVLLPDDPPPPPSGPSTEPDEFVLYPSCEVCRDCCEGPGLMDVALGPGEGVLGSESDGSRDCAIEPIDGDGGLGGIAPCLGPEEGPGGLEWDPSATNRTLYKGNQTFPAESTRQGNNRHTKRPYVESYNPSTNEYGIRFEANRFRRFTAAGASLWEGRYRTRMSRLVMSGDPGVRVLTLNDMAGKAYVFEEMEDWRCTKIQAIGGAEITFAESLVEGAGEIVVRQKPSAAGAEVRRFIYSVEADLIREIRVEEYVGAAWVHYRTIRFTYCEDVLGSVECLQGDLIGIEDERLLSPSTAVWVTKHWVFKYYTATMWSEEGSPGTQYQIKAVIGPKSCRRFEVDGHGDISLIHTKTTEELEALNGRYIDKKYEYHEDGSPRRVELRTSCGCGSGGGVHTYTWATALTPPANLNLWYRRVTITLPNGTAKWFDYNEYGQTLNSVTADNTGRTWIETWIYDLYGGVMRYYPPPSCDSYDQTTHTVAVNASYGTQLAYTIDFATNAVTEVKAYKPGGGFIYLSTRSVQIVPATWTAVPKRYQVNSETVFPVETLNGLDPTRVTTSYTHLYHPADPLALRIRTTTLPRVLDIHNGSNAQFTVADYFEPDGLHTWQKDAEGFIHYTGYDPNQRTKTREVRDLSTQSPPVLDPPLPAPPDPLFQSSPGTHQNIVCEWKYDRLRRLVEEKGPAFQASLPGGVGSVQTTRQWFYTRLGAGVPASDETGELVTIEYPHLGGTYYHVPLRLTVNDYEGRTLTSAEGELTLDYQNLSIEDDFNSGQTTLSAWFRGVLTGRRDSFYEGDVLVREEVWSVATNPTSKYITEHAYTPSGLRVRTVNAVGTITRWTFDSVNRDKSVWVGTNDAGATDSDPTGGGAAGNNMTKVEERYWDNEELDTRKDKDSLGSLTRTVRFTNTAGDPARQTDFVHDWRARVVTVYEPLGVKRTASYTNRDQPEMEDVYDINTGQVLLARAMHFYDSWGQEYESRVWGVEAGAANGFSSVRRWRSGRGLLVKTQVRGKVFQKTQYDGAGRVTKESMSFDLGELGATPSYEAAFDLANDTVMEERRYVRDATGAAILAGTYERNHNGTGPGPLTVGSTGNSRPQFTATWSDFLGRATHMADYGTNGGADMTARPASPPVASGPTVLLTQYSYSVAGTAVPRLDVEWVTDPRGLVTMREYDDVERLSRVVEAYVDGVPGPATDEDRTREFVYNGVNQVTAITAKASDNDQVTAYDYGVTKGAENSTVSSNDLLKTIRFPDPDPIPAPPGQPSLDADDQEVFGYNAQGEVVWRRDQNLTEHAFDYDARARLLHDRVTVCNPVANPNLDCTVRRLSRSYDALDRLVSATSHDDAAVGTGTVLNEVRLSYGRYSVVTSVQEAWAGAVGLSLTRTVGYAWSYPTDGTTALRRDSTTYPSLKVIADVYSAGTDDTISRLTGRMYLGSWLFQERYLGLGRLVQREYGSTGTRWTLIGPNPNLPSLDPQNYDYYFGLDRFGREDDLVLYQNYSSSTLNRYQYTYNENSQVTVREDLAGNLYGWYVFDETYGYDRVHRLVDRKRGSYDPFTYIMGSLQEHECFTMDRSGNRTAYLNAVVTNYAPPWTWTAGYNASNEVSTWSYGTVVHDSAGNLKQKGSLTFLHDAWNRFVKAKSGGVDLAAYKYNALGQKIERTGFYYSPSRYYYYSGDQVVEEWSVSGGSLSMDYVWGTQYVDDLVVRNLASREYMFLDRQSSVMTRLYSSGSVLARHLYDAYGSPKQLSATWTTFQTITEDLHLFTGRYWHKDHVQYDYRARWYDPQWGKFVERDPMGVWHASWEFGNAFTYTGNDPHNSVDPFGLQLEIVGPRELFTRDKVSEFAQAVLSALSQICPCFLYTVDPKTGLVTASTNGTYELFCRCYCNHLAGCNLIFDLITSTPVTRIRSERGQEIDEYKPESGRALWDRKWKPPVQTEEGTELAPPHLGLAHELIHARHLESTRKPLGAAEARIEEDATVRGENQIRRSEHPPLPFRTEHKGRRVPNHRNPNLDTADRFACGCTGRQECNCTDPLYSIDPLYILIGQ
jgi:RHS repeat-associated protein